MSSGKNKILEDTINYLKFYQEHSSYTVYKNEINISDFSSGIFEKERVKVNLKPKEKSKPGEVLAVSQNIIKNDKEIFVKETFANAMPPKEGREEGWMECSNLDSFAEAIKDCPKCRLLAETRKQVVFGTGNPNADVVVVGEAPGADEDVQGKPFVGRAGKLLTEILKAINFSREEVFICNILKCRPPDNRNPMSDEIANCEPYLFKQLEMIKPKLILAVGTFAAQTLLRSKEPLGKMRGKFYTYKGIKMMVTYHPAALLRNPNWKKPTWEDVQLFRKEYDRIVESEK